MREQISRALKLKGHLEHAHLVCTSPMNGASGDFAEAYSREERVMVLQLYQMAGGKHFLSAVYNLVEYITEEEHMERFFHPEAFEPDDDYYLYLYGSDEQAEEVFRSYEMEGLPY